MSNKSIETLVGFFVMLGIASLVFMALKAANLASFDRGDSYKLTARFDNIGGLKVRAPVRSAGVLVGRVTGIMLDAKTFQGVVSLEVDPRFQFPVDSTAKILTSGLLGDQYLGIEPGGDERYIAAGGAIAQTQSAVVLESLIGQFLSGVGGDSGPPPASGAAK
jgi:phospholipid/cholesterol/gamma-HCH transport system substrate-binding protein